MQECSDANIGPQFAELRVYHMHTSQLMERLPQQGRPALGNNAP